MYGYQFYNMQLAARDHGWARMLVQDWRAAVLLVFLGQRHFVVVRLITVEQFLRVSIDFTRSIGTFALTSNPRAWPATARV